MSGIAAAAIGAAGAIGGAVGGIIGRKKEGDRMHTRNKEYMDIQSRNNQQLMDKQHSQNQEQMKMQQGFNLQNMDHSNEKQKELWDYTNYENQRKHMEAAGLNPGLMYGMSGGGGATAAAPAAGASSAPGAGLPSSSSASAPDTNATGAGIQGMAMMAQIQNIVAQTKKTTAEAEKISGTDTKESEARTTAQEFQNKLNEEIGIEEYRRNYGWASDKLQTESEKANADWETYKSTGYQGKAYDDKTSPIAKAMEAGWEQKLEELKEAKTNNDIKSAESVIKDFEAKLAEQGIHPQSPWYVKLIGDLLEKSGIINHLKK